MNDFVVLFVPIFALGAGAIWFGLNSAINFLINIAAFALGGLCMVICAFALLVQYVNWKYYKE